MMIVFTDSEAASGPGTVFKFTSDRPPAVAAALRPAVLASGYC